MTWYLVAPLTAGQDAVTVPSARVRLTDDGVAGGVLDWAEAGADAIRKAAATTTASRIGPARIFWIVFIGILLKGEGALML